MFSLYMKFSFNSVSAEIKTYFNIIDKAYSYNIILALRSNPYHKGNQICNFGRGLWSFMQSLWCFGITLSVVRPFVYATVSGRYLSSGETLEFINSHKYCF